MAEERNYSRLAQMIAHKHLTEAIIDDILKDGSVNYQIPVNSIQDSKKKELEGCTALHIVMQDVNNIKVAKKLFKNGADFTIQNSIGETVLHQIIQTFLTLFSQVLPIKVNLFVNALLDAHVLLNISKNPSDNHQLSHFHIACINDHEEAVKFFIKKSVSLDTPVSFNSLYLPGYTPLHLAAKNSNFGTFKILLDEGADVTLKNAFGLSPLHLLIQNNKESAVWMEVNQELLRDYQKLAFRTNSEIIKSILINYQNKKIDILDDTGLSYFHVLCTLQNTSAIEEYLSNNDVDMQHSVKADSLLWPGYTALHFAALFSPATVKVLLKCGANMLAKDAKGWTPLDLCLKKCKVEDIRSIIESHQGWKEIMLSDGETSLLELIDAMKSGNSLEIFIQRADVNACIPMDSPLWPGYTPLHLAIMFFQTDVMTLRRGGIRIILDAGANVTAPNLFGATPIHFASRFRMYDDLNSMLNTNQSIIDSVDEHDVSHLHIACAAGNSNVVRSILRGDLTNVNLRLKRNYKFEWLDLPLHSRFFVAGSTPLHIAVIKRNVELAGLLVEHGADVHVKDQEGLTPIHRLLDSEYRPHVAPMAKILFSVDNLKDAETSFGLNHLHVACWASHNVAMEKLLDQGVDVNCHLWRISDLLVSRTGPYQPLKFLEKKYRYYSTLNFALCRKQSNVMELLFRRTRHFVGHPRDVLDAARYTRESSTYEGFKKTHSAMVEAWELDRGIKSIHVACYQFDTRAVEELLKQGADPNAKVPSTTTDWSGLTPLHLLADYVYADEKKIETIAKILIDHGADVTITDAEGSTLIHEVISNWGFRNKETLSTLLKGQKNFTVNPGADSHRISHFHAACILNETSVVEKFSKHGVDVNVSVNPMISFYGGYTPLQLAALCNAKETVELLLKRGADVDARDGVGNSALHCAAICYKKICGDRGISEPIVLSLVGAGAEVNATNKYGETPLEVLLKTQKPANRLLKILLKGQCCVNAFNNTDRIGFIATAIKRLTNIKSIFEHSVYQAVINSPKINQVDKDGRSPVHNIVSIPKIAASVQTYRKAIKGLLNLGIDVNQEDKMGQTALHAAVYFKNSKAVAALLALGANINVQLNGETPFFYHWKNLRNIPSANLLQNERQIIKSFAKEVYKLQLIDFHVHEMDKEIVAEIQVRHGNLDLKTVEQCQVELERMETRKIGRSNIPWGSLLLETGVIAVFPTMRQVERQMIHDFFENPISSLDREFPEFAGILHLQYRKALERMDLIEPAKAALGLLLNFDLPDLCSDLILKFVWNAELIYMIDAVENPISHVQKTQKNC